VIPAPRRATRCLPFPLPPHPPFSCPLPHNAPHTITTAQVLQGSRVRTAGLHAATAVHEGWGRVERLPQGRGRGRLHGMYVGEGREGAAFGGGPRTLVAGFHRFFFLLPCPARALLTFFQGFVLVAEFVPAPPRDAAHSLCPLLPPSLPPPPHYHQQMQRNAYFLCKRSQLDMRTRIRGTRVY